MTNKELRKIEKLQLQKLTEEQKIELFIKGDHDTLIKSIALFLWKTALSYAKHDRLLASDYMSILLEGAAIAITKYDSEKTQYISSYITTCSINKLKESFVRKKSKKRSAIHIEYQDILDNRLEENIIFQEDIEVENDKKLDFIFTKIKKKDLNIMKLLREGKSQKEIAELHGCSHQNINAKITRIISELQSHI